MTHKQRCSSGALDATPVYKQREREFLKAEFKRQENQK